MSEAVLSGNRTFDSPEALACEVADWLCALARASSGSFAVCLSGGSTPKPLYRRLADPAVARRFPWERAHWFWGDERFVPQDHPDSNYRMARDTLLSHVPAPAENIHPIPTEGLSPAQSAAAYEATLKRYYRADVLAPDRPLFNVSLLGIGTNGHTASLFPGHPALHETQRWVVPVMGAASEPRITLTFPVLDSSRDLVFLAMGDAKRDVIARAQAGDPEIPAAKVHPVGRLHWFIDRAATPNAVH
jgi:6-phosphogluconolactonase